MNFLLGGVALPTITWNPAAHGNCTDIMLNHCQLQPLQYIVRLMKFQLGYVYLTT